MAVLEEKGHDRDSLDRRIARLVFESDDEIIANPWPLWKELQEIAPVVPSGPLYLITRHQELKEVHRDAARFSSNSRRYGTRAAVIRNALTPERREAWDEIAAFHGIWMVTMDEPDHIRQREIAHRAFTPRRIAELGEAMRVYVNEAIDRLAGRDEADLMELALEVPLMIMTDLIGVPPEDRQLIKDFSRDWFAYQFTTDDRMFLSLNAQRGMIGYVKDMIDENRRNPNPTSLVETFLGAEHDERLSEDELAGMFFLLLFAGHETTTNLIATGVLELLRNRDQWEALVADPTLVPNAVEEMVRCVSPTQFLNRVAIVDVTLAGTEIPKGSSVVTLLAAANRDPLVFDDPWKFNIRRRDAGKNVSFGFGKHFCLGNSLSRLEGTIALEALTQRVPELELATDTFTWRGGPQLRGLESLPVRIGRVRA
jgi:cytochrome P450